MNPSSPERTEETPNENEHNETSGLQKSEHESYSVGDSLITEVKCTAKEYAKDLQGVQSIARKNKTKVKKREKDRMLD